MAGSKVYGSSDMTVLLQNKRLPCSADVYNSLWVPSSDPSLHGSPSMVNFDIVNGRDRTDDRQFLRPLDKEENGSDDCDVYFNQHGKKRRLTTDQVHFLEKSFEIENKLEPERKVQLANELGLLPRQVAIWFQNRRARFKTKQLEKDYYSLKTSYDKLKLDYDNLLKENENLRNEVNSLKSRLVFNEDQKEKENIRGSVDTVDKSDKETLTKPIPHVDPGNGIGLPRVACKQEDANSVKSDVFDSDSPHYTDCNHSTFLEPADSSHAFGPEQSDFSQDEEDNLSKSLLPFQFLPKAEDACYDDPTDNSCNFGFPVEDQTFCFWP